MKKILKIVKKAVKRQKRSIRIKLTAEQAELMAELDINNARLKILLEESVDWALNDLKVHRNSQKN